MRADRVAATASPSFGGKHPGSIDTSECSHAGGAVTAGTELKARVTPRCRRRREPRPSAAAMNYRRAGRIGWRAGIALAVREASAEAVRMDREPRGDAEDLVAELFPQAQWALLAGSVTTSQRTAGSDLDVVVVLSDGDAQAPHRESRRWRGWPVELFVHDVGSLAFYLAKDLPNRRPIMHRMVATGIPLIGCPQPWQQRCAATLAAGPAPLTEQERDWCRYALTDLLDDLTHAIDPAERTVVAAAAWTAVAEQALALADHWTGTGKWLLRELRDHDADFADQWVAAHADPAATATLIRQVLDAHGGPLFEGYRAAGQRP